MKETKLSKKYLKLWRARLQPHKMGLNKGAKLQLRGDGGLHIHVYDRYIKVHWDRYDPRKNVFYHFWLDLVPAAIVFILNKVFKRGAASETD